MRKRDLLGQRFGKLTVIASAGRNSNGKTMWWCLCDCGEERFVEACDLVRGHRITCGCGKHEAVRQNNPNYRHGHCWQQGRLSRSTEYTAWLGMHTRCYNANSTYFEDYGGLGVVVCGRWHKSNPQGFQNFLA